jgi:small subunit ribosomal protein S21
LISDLYYRFFTAKYGSLWTWFTPKLMTVQTVLDQVHFIVFAKLRHISPLALVVEKSRYLKKVELYRKILLTKGGEVQMVSVDLKPGESPESLLRRFRKKVQRARILSDVRKKRFFVSDSEKRRIAKRKAVRRERRRLSKMRRRRQRFS